MLMLKNLGSALATIAILSLGVYSAKVTTKPYDPHMSKYQPTREDKLHPTCKQYLERHAVWYRYRDNEAEPKEDQKVTKVFRSSPYTE